MAKPNRGSAIRFMNGKPGRGRGICPLCKRTGVKLLWNATVDGNTTEVCKRCKSAGE